MNYLQFLAEWYKEVTVKEFVQIFGKGMGNHLVGVYMGIGDTSLLKLLWVLDDTNAEILQRHIDSKWAVYAADKAAAERSEAA